MIPLRCRLERIAQRRAALERYAAADRKFIAGARRLRHRLRRLARDLYRAGLLDLSIDE